MEYEKIIEKINEMPTEKVVDTTKTRKITMTIPIELINLTEALKKRKGFTSLSKTASYILESYFNSFLDK